MLRKILGISLLLILICSTSIYAIEEKNEWIQEFNEKMDIMQKAMELSNDERDIIENQIKPLIEKWTEIHQKIQNNQDSIIDEIKTKHKEEIVKLKLKYNNLLNQESSKKQNEGFLQKKKLADAEKSLKEAYDKISVLKIENEELKKKLIINN